MRQVASLLVSVLLVVSAVAGVAAAASAGGSPTSEASPTSVLEQTDDPETNTTAAENGSNRVAPGERLAGVFAVQGAELSGEIETRAYDSQLNASATNESKARVIAQRLNDTEQRLEQLRERKAELKQARENGSLSTGQYRARLATLSAEIRTVERLVAQSEQASETLPPTARERAGVDAEAIETLRRNASELHGSDVADAARSIAGEPPGQRVAGDRREANGVPGRGVAGADDNAESETADENETEHATDEAFERPAHAATGDGADPDANEVPLANESAAGDPGPSPTADPDGDRPTNASAQATDEDEDVDDESDDTNASATVPLGNSHRDGAPGTASDAGAPEKASGGDDSKDAAGVPVGADAPADESVDATDDNDATDDSDATDTDDSDATDTDDSDATDTDDSDATDTDDSDATDHVNASAPGHADGPPGQPNRTAR